MNVALQHLPNNIEHYRQQKSPSVNAKSKNLRVTSEIRSTDDGNKNGGAQRPNFGANITRNKNTHKQSVWRPLNVRPSQTFKTDIEW